MHLASGIIHREYGCRLAALAVFVGDHYRPDTGSRTIQVEITAYLIIVNKHNISGNDIGRSALYQLNGYIASEAGPVKITDSHTAVVGAAVGRYGCNRRRGILNNKET